MADISPRELKHRVEVIKRFKEVLKAQRDRFNAYLDTLERQKDVIERGTAEDLLRHVELEEKIVADIFSIQKVIDPLEKMYHTAKAPPPAKGRQAEPKHPDRDEVSSLKEALDGLKAEAVIRSERNRELLGKRMAELRAEIKTLKSNPYARRSGGNNVTPTQVDIRG